MEFNRDAGGSLAPLPAASIDTGMGLERIVAIVQQKASNYDTDLFAPLLHAIGGQTGRVYGPLAPGGAAGPDDVSMRVVADHLRAMTFLIADGVMPLQRMARLRAAQDSCAARCGTGRSWA